MNRSLKKRLLRAKSVVTVVTDEGPVAKTLMREAVFGDFKRSAGQPEVHGV